MTLFFLHHGHSFLYCTQHPSLYIPFTSCCIFSHPVLFASCAFYYTHHLIIYSLLDLNLIASCNVYNTLHRIFPSPPCSSISIFLFHPELMKWIMFPTFLISRGISPVLSMSCLYLRLLCDVLALSVMSWSVIQFNPSLMSSSSSQAFLFYAMPMLHVSRPHCTAPLTKPLTCTSSALQCFLLPSAYLLQNPLHSNQYWSYEFHHWYFHHLKHSTSSTGWVIIKMENIYI